MFETKRLLKEKNSGYREMVLLRDLEVRTHHSHDHAQPPMGWFVLFFSGIESLVPCNGSNGEIRLEKEKREKK